MWTEEYLVSENGCATTPNDRVYKKKKLKRITKKKMKLH